MCAELLAQYCDLSARFTLQQIKHEIQSVDWICRNLLHVSLRVSRVLLSKELVYRQQGDFCLNDEEQKKKKKKQKPFPSVPLCLPTGLGLQPLKL